MKDNTIKYAPVTGILGILDKPALISWASNCAVDFIKENNSLNEDVLKQARSAFRIKRDSSALVGTKIHNAIKAYILNKDYKFYLDTNQAQEAFKAFLKWESENKVKWLECELDVKNEEVGYQGRIDAIALVNGVKTLIDFKSSKGIYDEMKYQLCAYLQAYNQNKVESEKVKDIAILLLNKETGLPSFNIINENIERMTMLFNNLTKVYYLMKNRRLKNNPIVKSIKELN